MWPTSCSTSRSAFDLQPAIISCYVTLFGVLLCAFSLGAKEEVLRRWFGFLYTPQGQVLFLLIAGNLAWCIGTLGIIAALATNAHAALSWYTTHTEQSGAARGAAVAPRRAWRGRGEQRGGRGSDRGRHPDRTALSLDGGVAVGVRG